MRNSSLHQYWHQDKQKSKQNIRNDSKKPLQDQNKINNKTEEPDIEMQVFNNKSIKYINLDQQRNILSNTNNQVMPAFILIAPADLINYNQTHKQMQIFIDHYEGRQNLFDLILKNLRDTQVKNIDNLLNIRDQQFWNKTIPKLIHLLLKNKNIIASCIRTLPSKETQIVQLTRLQILIILGSMFLCYMPAQCYSVRLNNFSYWMECSQNRYQSNACKIEKLKCIVNYFKIMVNNQQIFNQTVKFHRVNQEDTLYLTQKNKKHRPMKSVTVKLMGLNQKIQEHYGQAAMIDFANKKIGGAVLQNNCTQQEILFLIFPQSIVTKLLCQSMNDNQALLIYNAKRFSYYKGYQSNFAYDGQFPSLQSQITEKSLIIAIDATDFSRSKGLLEQYQKNNIRREVHKAFVGFSAVQFNNQFPICTGKWGCGAFKGDEPLKFLIQWIACSLSQRQMIYITDDIRQVKQLTFLVDDLINLTTQDMLGILDDFYKIRQKLIFSKTHWNLLEYIKTFIN